MTETIVDGPGPRHAFAPHPVPVEGLRASSLRHLPGVRRPGVSRIGTEMMAPSLDSAERFVDRLNEILGIDRAERVALAARAFAVESEPAPGDGP